MKYDEAAYDHLKESLRIDRDMLDEELIAQVQHFWHVAEACEQATSVMDKRKYDVELVEVEVDRDVREQMVADGEKVTEKLVEASIKRDDRYQHAVDAYIRAKGVSGRWHALRDAYRQRRDVLIELSRSRQQRFYDEYTGASDTRDARNRFDARARSVVPGLERRRM